jgi:titin
LINRITLSALLLAVVSALGLLGTASPVSAATYEVDTTSDASLTACTVAAGDCSLRGAITNANSNAGTDTINFAIGSGAQTIGVTSALPTIGEALIIDGTTQPGFIGTPLIELDGTNAGAGIDGLNISGGGSTVRGLVINRFPSDGIYLQTGDSNTVVGNFIGTDVTGGLDLGNGEHGIRIDVGSLNNTIGGSSVSDRNVISGNTGNGVFVSANSTGQTIKGNYIGVNAAGLTALGNTGTGINANSTGNTVGGAAAGERNLVSGNGFGIQVAGSSTVKGNLVGTDVTGTVDLGNTGVGIFVSGTGTVVGGPEAGARNVVSGNNNSGISVSGTSTAVQGNYIGTDITGSADLGNTTRGIFVTGASNSIGGSGAGEGNVVSGNDTTGIELNSGTATGNTVQGNIIGLNAAGTADLGNTQAGVLVVGGATGNFIGDTSAGARNVISGNNAEGVFINSLSSTGNAVRGNYIGTNAAGTAAIANTTNGVRVSGNNNTIGSSSTTFPNVISGNTSHGIKIDNGVTGTNVGGNLIGTAADGATAIGNGGAGVSLESSPTATSIGRHGTTGTPNTIANNTGDGIQVVTGTANLVGMNSISANGGLGIDLGTNGVTANDNGPPPDPDTGANNLQNFPVLTSAVASGQQAIVSFTLNSTPSATFSLRFFANASCDASGNGEGATPIEQLVSATTDANGTISSSVGLLTTVAAGQFITAIATDSSFNTSEFSACVTVTSDTDIDNDGVADGGDNCPAFANPGQGPRPWTVPANDIDCDGFPSALETTLGTNPVSSCAVPGIPDAWPPDFNQSGSVSVTDVLAIKPHFGLAVPPAPVRFDIKPSNSISVTDVLELKPYFGLTCS